MYYKACIFDMDGTITNTSAIWKAATQLLIQDRAPDQACTPRLADRIHGKSMRAVCEILKQEFALEATIEQLIQQKTQIACDLYSTLGVGFIPGFLEFYAQVQKAHLKTAVATNADDATLALTDRMLKLSKLFGTHMYNITFVNQKGKPDPAIYLYAAAQLGVEPSRCLAIEDSATGIASAKAAGMTCIGINTSGNYAQIKQADITVDTYEQIDLKTLLASG